MDVAQVELGAEEELELSSQIPCQSHGGPNSSPRSPRTPRACSSHTYLGNAPALAPCKQQGSSGVGLRASSHRKLRRMTAETAGL